MEDYKLTSWNLHFIIHLLSEFHHFRACHIYDNGYGADKEGWHNPVYIQDLKRILEPKFFNPLLLKQPELASDVEKFWEDCKTQKYLESAFSHNFADKIFLKNIHQHVFNNSYSLTVNNSERKTFIKDMINKSPTLMMELHNHLKTVNDDILLYAYAESLPKHIGQIKDTTENIWDRLKKLNLNWDSTAVNLLSPIVKSFKHDEAFYQVLKDIFSPKFEKFHALREKFHKFEQKHFSKFKIDEHIELFDNFQEYRFTVAMKDRVLVDNFGISKGSVMEIQKQIHECIKEFLDRNMPTSGLYYSYSSKGFEINAPNFEDKPQIDLYMSEIQPIIKTILTSLPEKNKQFPDKETVYKMFTSALLKIELDETLDSKEIHKTKKHKL